MVFKATLNNISVISLQSIFYISTINNKKLIYNNNTIIKQGN